jgi:stress responsive alpha/beta barrel protein
VSARRVALVALREGALRAAVAELADALARAGMQAPGALRSHAAPHLPGSLGGGDLTWDVLFESEVLAAADPALGALQAEIARVDAVVVAPIRRYVAKPALAGIKRTLLLRASPSADPARVAAFERDMLELPRYVPAIRNWSFARAARGPWTHVWEQEFETVEGLSEDYMLSPYHWGLVDGWFDVECPQCVVEPRLAHVFCAARESVLAWGS